MKLIKMLGTVSSLAILVLSCAHHSPRPQDKAREMEPSIEMNGIAEKYVKLVLALGTHDSIYVDAYYGPKTWAQEAKKKPKSLAEIREEALEVISQLKERNLSGDDERSLLRQRFLQRQLKALVTRTEILTGRKLNFDEESKELYDAVAPQLSEQQFKTTLAALDKLIPGKGNLSERVERYRAEFVIPMAKIKSVFEAAIVEARKRTALHIELPPEENFELEFVKNKSWSAYNWYKGNSHSLIQINTDLPIYIDRAIDLACHEGYPGHHVYNVLLEQHLVRHRGWVEFSIYPLFSPQSLIAEGTGNFGIEVAFPGVERVQFEKDVLFKLAGLDVKKAEKYYQILALLNQLNYAGNEAARRYLNGEIDRKSAVEWLVKHTLATSERAEQRTRFFDEYRSYVINYNLGQDLVKNYIEKLGGVDSKPAKRWEEFKKLISSPRLPSDLK